MLQIHPIADIGVEIAGYTAGIGLVVWLLTKIFAKVNKGNQIIKNAEFLPGGKQNSDKYIHAMEEEAEFEELTWKVSNV